MTPTQTFENYPEFANAGQKSQPTDAKYAAGFIPSDVLPAEWLNWFLNGATKGVTALNTGVRSIEQEINTVLESRAVTPDINADGQLLAVLNKIKAEAINEAWPVGITYVQYPQQKAPEDLFPGTTWQVVDYSGAFFRAEGGNAAGFIEKTSALSKQEGQNLAHSHGVSGSVSISAHRHGQNMEGNDEDPNVYYPHVTYNKYTGNLASGYPGGHGSWKNSRAQVFTDYASPTATLSASITTEGGDENRPANFTVRIWKRVA